MRQYSLNGFSRPGRIKDILALLLKRGSATMSALGLLTISALIAGCGGGGGSGDGAGVSPQVVSGVAATGSPLAGGQVFLKGTSSGQKDSKIEDDGSFSIDVSGMTPPFILKATGTVDGVNRTLFSFADKPGRANINPLSTVALANAAGVDDPATVFDNSDSAMLDKVKSAMPGAVATLQSKLKPLLDVFSVASTNPVSDPFTADHDGLDAVFDNVKVVLSNGTLTITNVDTGAVLFTAQVRDVEHGRFTDNDDDVPKRGPRPGAPTGVTAVGGDGQVTVSWDPVENATSYDLFFTTRSKVAEDDDRDDEHVKRVKNVTSPFVVTGLTANTTYFFMVRARINNRRGPPSAEVSATTTGTTPPTTTTVAGTTTTTAPGATTTSTAGATTTSTTAGQTTSSTSSTSTTATSSTSTTSTSTTSTSTTTTSTTTTTLAPPNGAALFTQNCVGCHGALGSSDVQGASAALITSAIANNRGGMGTRFNATTGTILRLTPTQIAAISAALQ
jgi:mono/diheme cytochrome c family protein